VPVVMSSFETPLNEALSGTGRPLPQATKVARSSAAIAHLILFSLESCPKKKF
jgi:hypothetical protein